MRKKISPELFEAVAILLHEALTKLLQEYGIESTPTTICDVCQDENKEAFPYYVWDTAGKFHQDLCNDCYEAMDRMMWEYDEDEDDE